MRNGQILTFLLDTGSNKNYIRSNLVENPRLNKRIFGAKSVAGDIQITQHTLIDLFGIDDVPIKFYLLPGLVSFDGILGNDSLKELSAIIHTAENYFTVRGGKKVHIKQRLSQNVNNLELRTQHLHDNQRISLENLVKQHRCLFAAHER